MNSSRVIRTPVYVGEAYFCGVYYQLTEMPNWFHRMMWTLVFGVKWRRF